MIKPRPARLPKTGARSRAVRVLGYVLLALAGWWLISWGMQVSRVLRETAVVHAGGMTVSTILSQDELQGLGALDQDFDVTSTGSVALRGGDRLYGVVSDSHELSDLGLADVPDSFAFDSHNVMLTVAGGFLGRMSADGKPVEAVPLAYPDARLARSVHPGVVYLFGGKNGSYRLYRFLEDGTFQILLHTDQPPVAATDSARGTYVATADMIVRVAWPEPVVLFKAPDVPGWGPLQSLAVAEDGLVFFSTPTSVYALKGGIAISVINDSGGSIRLRDGRLYVLDGKRRLLYSAGPAATTLFKGKGA